MLFFYSHTIAQTTIPINAPVRTVQNAILVLIGLGWDCSATTAGASRGLGHVARLLPSVQAYALDAQVERSDGAALAQDIRRDIAQTYRRMQKLGRREKCAPSPPQHPCLSLGTFNDLGVCQ